MIKQALPCLFSDVSPRPLLSAVKRLLSQKKFIDWGALIQMLSQSRGSELSNKLKPITITKNFLAIQSKFLTNPVAHSTPTVIATSTSFKQKFSPTKPTALKLSDFSLSLSLSPSTLTGQHDFNYFFFGYVIVT